jgi:tetratricopeptide (TPR) repeat protein
MRIFLSLIVTILLAPSFLAQNKKLDSLRQELSKIRNNDTARLSIMLRIAGIERKQSPDSGLFYFKSCMAMIDGKIMLMESVNPMMRHYQIKKAEALFNLGSINRDLGNLNKAEIFLKASLAIYEKYKYKTGIAAAFTELGINNYLLGKLDESLDYFEKCLKLREEIGDVKMIVAARNNLAVIYTHRGLPEKALECYKINLKYLEGTNDKSSLATAYNNVGIICLNQKRVTEAIQYFEKCAKAAIEGDSKSTLAKAYTNLASLYSDSRKIDLSIEYNKKAMEIEEQLGDKHGIVVCLSQIGLNYIITKQYDKAEEIFQKCLRLSEQISAKQYIAYSYVKLAEIRLQQNKLQEAEKLGIKGWEISKEVSVLTEYSDASRIMKEIYTKLNKPAQALKMYEIYIKMRDSVANEETKGSTLKKEYEIEFNAKEREVKLVAETEKKLLIQKQEEDSKRMTIIIVSVAVVLIIVSFFSVMLFNSLQKNKKINKIVNRQKELVEQKQKEVLDSIQYAKRLQNAILPSMERWHENLPQSFVLYKPKDIVAGDFFWMEKVNDLVLFAVGDCTGHGVPGAMVSVVCSTALNRSVMEFRLTDPGRILDKTRELVISTFEKNDKDVRDGMDISLCCLDIKSKTLLWAGANMWLAIVQNNHLGVLKPNKQPIGKFEKPQPFTTQKMQLQSGDLLYLSSDGYSDQFGGGSGKKFKTKHLMEFLLKNSGENIEEQKTLLDKAFTEWKGTLEQVDDVCVIGVRI